MLARRLSDVRDEHIRSLLQALRGVIRKTHYHSLDAERETEALSRRTAKHLRQPIVAAAPDNRVLSAKLVPDDLERGASVIVQSSHEPRRKCVRDVALAEHRGKTLKVFSTRVAQRIGDCRQLVQIRLARFDFAVEHAQRIRFVSLITASAKLREPLANRLFQFLDVTRPASFIANRVHQQLSARDAQLSQIPIEHLDYFGFDRRVVALAEDFHADLAELAIAAFLRALAPKLRSYVEKLCETGLIEQAVLDIGANHGSGLLGPQRHALAVAIFEGIHLLVDVGFGSDASLEQFGSFDDRSSNLFESIAAKRLAGGLFNKTPALDLRVGFFGEPRG